MGHVGNNEAVAAAIGRHGLPISVVADDSSFPEMFELLRRQRESWGVHVVAWRNLRAIFGVLRRREMLALLVDWGYRSDGIPVRLFGAWTALPAGPATLAAKTGSRILPVTIHRRPDDRFSVAWGEPIDMRSGDPAELQRVTQLLADALAEGVSAAPAQWYSFKPIWPATDAEGRRPRAPRTPHAGRPPGSRSAWATPMASSVRRRRAVGRGRVVTGLGRSADALAHRRVLARLSPAGRAADDGRRARRRPLVPARTRACRPGPAQSPAGLRGPGRVGAWEPGRPGRGDGSRALERLVRSAFRHNARYYLEVARTPALRPGDMDRRLDLETPDVIAEAFAPGRTVLFVGLHFGALELPALFLASRVGGAVAPMETIDDEALQAWFTRTRGAAGVRIVGLREARRELLAALRNGTAVGLVGDRDLTGGGALVPLFGAPAKLPLGPAMLAVESGAKPYVMGVRRAAHGRYRGRLEAIVVPAEGSRRERVTATMAAMATAFERIIEDAPAQWWAVFFPIWPDLEEVPA